MKLKNILTLLVSPCLVAASLVSGIATAKDSEWSHKDCHIYLLTGDEYGGFAGEFVEALQERGYVPVFKNKGDFINESEKGDLVFLFGGDIEFRSGLKPNEASMGVGLREVVGKVELDKEKVVAGRDVSYRLDYGEIKWATESQWFYGDRLDMAKTVNRAIREFPRCVAQ